MDGEIISAVTIVVTVNIVTVVSLIYYLKGKMEGLEKRLDDVYRYIETITKMMNARIKNVENKIIHK